MQMMFGDFQARSEAKAERGELDRQTRKERANEKRPNLPNRRGNPGPRPRSLDSQPMSLSGGSPRVSPESLFKGAPLTELTSLPFVHTTAFFVPEISADLHEG